MDSPWEEDPDHGAFRDAEWSKISSDFTNAGYREGITAGKESALQEGFDAGFADTGAPIGREIGRLRGISAAILAMVNSSGSGQDESSAAEARNIAGQLANLRFSDVAPRDLEAEEHARQHMEANDDHGMEVGEEMAEKREMEGIEDLLAKLTAGKNTKDPGRPTVEDLKRLSERLQALNSR